MHNLYKFLLAELEMRVTVSTGRRLSRFVKVYLLQITSAIITVEKITIVSPVCLILVTVEVALRERQCEEKNILAANYEKMLYIYKKKRRQTNLRWFVFYYIMRGGEVVVTWTFDYTNKIVIIIIIT